MSDSPDGPRAADSPAPAEVVGDALRTAVERTLAATADSATGTRQRAQGLLDDVVRRGQVARDEVARRSEGASSRLAEAINELRSADSEAIGDLAHRLGEVERRLAFLESRIRPRANPQVEAEATPADRHDQRDSKA